MAVSCSSISLEALVRAPISASRLVISTWWVTGVWVVGGMKWWMMGGWCRWEEWWCQTYRLLMLTLNQHRHTLLLRFNLGRWWDGGVVRWWGGGVVEWCA